MPTFRNPLESRGPWRPAATTAVPLFAVAVAIAACTCIAILDRRCPAGGPDKYLTLPTAVLGLGGVQMLDYPMVPCIRGPQEGDPQQLVYANGIGPGPAGSGPGYVPIESAYDVVNIPGTSLYVGTVMRMVQQTWTQEVITRTERLGQRLGCGHMVYNIHEYTTAIGVYRGLGGQCSFCTAQAAALLQENQITLPQAEAKSLYCSRCGRGCQACGRNNVCSRHVRLLEVPGSRPTSLCIGCLQPVKTGCLRRAVIATLSFLFLDRNRPSGPRS